MNPEASKYLAAIGRRGGKAKGGAKAAAARLNGKRGGRPKIKRADNVTTAMAHCGITTQVNTQVNEKLSDRRGE